MKKKLFTDFSFLLKPDQEDPMENYFIVLKDNKKVCLQTVSNVLYNTLDFDDYVYTLDDNVV